MTKHREKRRSVRLGDSTLREIPEYALGVAVGHGLADAGHEFQPPTGIEPVLAGVLSDRRRQRDVFHREIWDGRR